MKASRPPSGWTACRRGPRRSSSERFHVFPLKTVLVFWGASPSASHGALRPSSSSYSACQRQHHKTDAMVGGRSGPPSPMTAPPVKPAVKARFFTAGIRKRSQLRTIPVAAVGFLFVSSQSSSGPAWADHQNQSVATFFRPRSRAGLPPATGQFANCSQSGCWKVSAALLCARGSCAALSRLRPISPAGKHTPGSFSRHPALFTFPCRFHAIFCSTSAMYLRVAAGSSCQKRSATPPPMRAKGII